MILKAASQQMKAQRKRTGDNLFFQVVYSRNSEEASKWDTVKSTQLPVFNSTE